MGLIVFLCLSTNTLFYRYNQGKEERALLKRRFSTVGDINSNVGDTISTVKVI